MSWVISLQAFLSFQCILKASETKQQRASVLDSRLLRVKWVQRPCRCFAPMWLPPQYQPVHLDSLRRHKHLSAPSLQQKSLWNSWQHLAPSNEWNVIPRWQCIINPTKLPCTRVYSRQGTSKELILFEIKQVLLLGIWTTSERIHSFLWYFQGWVVEALLTYVGSSLAGLVGTQPMAVNLAAFRSPVTIARKPWPKSRDRC